MEWPSSDRHSQFSVRTEEGDEVNIVCVDDPDQVPETIEEESDDDNESSRSPPPPPTEPSSEHVVPSRNSQPDASRNSQPDASRNSQPDASRNSQPDASRNSGRDTSLISSAGEDAKTKGRLSGAGGATGGGMLRRGAKAREGGGGGARGMFGGMFAGVLRKPKNPHGHKLNPGG